MNTFREIRNKDNVVLNIPKFERFVTLANPQIQFPVEHRNVCVVLSNQKYIYFQMVELPKCKLPEVQKLNINKSKGQPYLSMNIFELIKLEIHESFFKDMRGDQEKMLADSFQGLKFASTEDGPITSNDLIMIRHVFSGGFLKINLSQSGELEVSSKVDFFKRFLFRIQSRDSKLGEKLHYNTVLNLVPCFTGKPFIFELPLSKCAQLQNTVQDSFAEQLKSEIDKSMFPTYVQREMSLASELVMKEHSEKQFAPSTPSQNTFKPKSAKNTSDMCLIAVSEIDLEIAKTTAVLLNELRRLSDEIEKIGFNPKFKGEFFQQISNLSKLDLMFFEEEAR